MPWKIRVSQPPFWRHRASLLNPPQDGTSARSHTETRNAGNRVVARVNNTKIAWVVDVCVKTRK